MGDEIYSFEKWQEKEANQARLRPLQARLCPSPAEPDFSSPSAESAVSSDTPTTPSASVPVPPSISLPCSSTLPLRCSNSLATPPRTTRRPGSYPDTSCWPSATTKSSTSYSTTPPSPKEVCSPTSADPSPVPSRAVASHPRQFDRIN